MLFDAFCTVASMLNRKCVLSGENLRALRKRGLNGIQVFTMIETLSHWFGPTGKPLSLPTDTSLEGQKQDERVIHGCSSAKIPTLLHQYVNGEDEIANISPGRFCS